jgi:hypothetical protein
LQIEAGAPRQTQPAGLFRGQSRPGAGKRIRNCVPSPGREVHSAVPDR